MLILGTLGEPSSHLECDDQRGDVVLTQGELGELFLEPIRELFLGNTGRRSEVRIFLLPDVEQRPTDTRRLAGCADRADGPVRR